MQNQHQLSTVEISLSLSLIAQNGLQRFGWTSAQSKALKLTLITTSAQEIENPFLYPLYQLLTPTFEKHVLLILH
jgi:hypothetical protein